MNAIYSKTVLYGYNSIDKLIKQTEDLMLKRALASMHDFSPADKQAKRLYSYILTKDLLLRLKKACKIVFKKMDDEQLNLLDYKYLKKKTKEYYADFDTTSRRYFRRQNKLVDFFGDKLEKLGLTDSRFEKTYLKIPFFAEMCKMVANHGDDGALCGEILERVFNEGKNKNFKIKNGNTKTA